MADKRMLQGVAPLTLVIPDGGVARYVHAGHLCDPDGIDDTAVERLIDEKYLRWVTVTEEGLVTPEDTPDGPASTGAAPAQASNVNPEPLPGTHVDPAVESARAAARAKLPADGSPPHGNASHEVWVEFAVAQGMDRAEAEKATSDELRDALKS